MTDNGFVGYEPENFSLSSPGYFSTQFMEDYLKNDFAHFANQNTLPKPTQTQTLSESPDHRAIETMSNDSNSSTNYSSKYSPDNIDNTDNQSGIDRRSEDDAMRHQAPTPLVKKNITKFYEPLVDNNVVYNFDQDPSEYKKARKRIQNRESASRIRNKKRNHVEDLEVEMNMIRRENADLKVQCAALKAENNLLKQQTCFLERMIMKTGPQSMTNNPINNAEQNFQECLLPLVNKAEEKSTTKSTGYFRAAPPHTFKKHAMFLGMLTILICASSFIGGSSDSGIKPFYPRTLDEFKNNYSMGLKNIDIDPDAPGSSIKNDLDKSISDLLKANEEYNSLKSLIKTLFTTSYIIYFIYVLLITNWKYLFRMKSKKVL